MTPKQEFQKEFAPDYAKIVASRPFVEAMQVLNVEKLQNIANLDNEEIERHSREILADLRGHLKHETNLFTLHEEKSFDMTDLPTEDYSEGRITIPKPKRKKKP